MFNISNYFTQLSFLISGILTSQGQQLQKLHDTTDTAKKASTP